MVNSNTWRNQRERERERERERGTLRRLLKEKMSFTQHLGRNVHWIFKELVLTSCSQPQFQDVCHTSWESRIFYRNGAKKMTRQLCSESKTVSARQLHPRTAANACKDCRRKLAFLKCLHDKYFRFSHFLPCFTQGYKDLLTIQGFERSFQDSQSRCYRRLP